MFLVDTVILVAAVLLLLGIVSSKLSARLGLPVLVLFLGLGMLAGEEGPGGIAFENYSLAHGIGSLALAVILFDGGLVTPIDSVRAVWRPAAVLATLGVLVTALVTGLATAWMLDIPVLEGVLLGSIVGSTDAAAVFAVLRYGGVTLPKRLAATLEVESGANDPMAVFLTIGCIEVLTGRMDFGIELFGLFLAQMLIGSVIGILVGQVAVGSVNRINLDTAGLYPVLVAGFGLLAYGLAAQLGGSGFLATYLAGLVFGNSQTVFRRAIRLFHDAAAWLAQILMFVVLGLLSFPSRLLDAAPQGLLIGVVLIFLARPIAVAATMPFFGYTGREMLFISWVGLKGAVPITLATFPLLLGLPDASLLFDIVFFVVVLSAVVQGWALPPVARWLGLERPPEPQSPVSLEIMSLRHIDGDIVDFTVGEQSRAAGRRVRDLALPEGVVIALIVRGQQVIPPHGDTLIEAGDHAILVLRPDVLPLATQIFSAEATENALPQLLEFPLRPSVTVGELEEVYGIEMNVPRDCTLDEAFRKQLGKKPLEPGTMERFGPIALHVREVTPDGRVARIGMVVLPSEVASEEDGEMDSTATAENPSEQPPASPPAGEQTP